MKRDKKLLILSAVLIFLIMAIIFRVKNPYTQKEIRQLTYNSGSVQSAQKGKNTKSLGNNIDKQNYFSTAVEEYFITDKHNGFVHTDLFEKYTPPVKRPVFIAEKRKIVSPSQHPVVPQKDPIKEAKDYLKSYRLYGTYKKNGSRALFLSRNKMMLVARIGDRIDGKYHIDDINDKSIKIKALDINKTFHLDLREFKNEE